MAPNPVVSPTRHHFGVVDGASGRAMGLTDGRTDWGRVVDGGGGRELGTGGEL